MDCVLSSGSSAVVLCGDRQQCTWQLSVNCHWMHEILKACSFHWGKLQKLHSFWFEKFASSTKYALKVTWIS